MDNAIPNLDHVKGYRLVFQELFGRTDKAPADDILKWHKEFEGQVYRCELVLDKMKAVN